MLRGLRAAHRRFALFVNAGATAIGSPQAGHELVLGAPHRQVSAVQMQQKDFTGQLAERSGGRPTGTR